MLSVLGSAVDSEANLGRRDGECTIPENWLLMKQNSPAMGSNGPPLASPDRFSTTIL